MRSFALGVVTAMSGRVPVFMHLPWCQLRATASPRARERTRPGSRRCRFLRSSKERERRLQELLRTLRHRQVTAPLDHAHLRPRQDRAETVDVANRYHEILAAPDEERGPAVTRGPGKPGFAQRTPNTS